MRFYCYYHFIENPDLNTNSPDPDHIPRSVASALGLHCF